MFDAGQDIKLQDCDEDLCEGGGQLSATKIFVIFIHNIKSTRE